MILNYALIAVLVIILLVFIIYLFTLRTNNTARHIISNINIMIARIFFLVIYIPFKFIYLHILSHCDVFFNRKMLII